MEQSLSSFQERYGKRPGQVGGRADQGEQLGGHKEGKARGGQVNGNW